ncbi:MAG: HigA family addiction module antitoxin [Phycisphaerae bacterium]|nr:HigA family addiction module antitoxin [Phycisphaerae bacterium]
MTDALAVARTDGLGVTNTEWLANDEEAPQATQPEAIHPGEVLPLDFLELMGISAYRLAKATGISAQHLGRIIKGTRGISADIASRLSRAFGTSAQVWMGLQARFDLDTAEELVGKEIERRVQRIETKRGEAA